MASFGPHYLSFFFLFALLLSPQIQAREGKVFSFFTHFRTTYNPKQPQVVLRKAKANPPALTPAPVPVPVPAPAPAPESILAPAPESEPDFADSGYGYGLYGSGSSYVSPNKETPSSTSFENNNELRSGEINGDKKSFRTGYPQTRLYSNNNYVNNNEEYRSNYYGNGYSNNYNKDRYYDSYNGNGYERERQGMSDTRFMENGKYYYDVKNENQKNYKVDGYELGRGSNENEGYYEKNRYPNEFDTMEEYEKQQESQGYIP